MKLSSMVDYVIRHSLKKDEKPQDYNAYMVNFHKKISEYATFLKTPLSIDMFLPEDKKETILFKGFEYEDCDRMVCFDKNGIEIFIYNKNYQTFSSSKSRLNTIEDLIIYELETLKFER